jgi:hypothetical protein
MGRTVKFTTVHASFLKPFKQGETQLALSTDGQPCEMRVASGLVDGDKSIVSLCDRKRHNEVWQYKIKYENGKQSNWLSEKTVLRWVSQILLDEYHSRYDLMEETQQPVYARRTPGQATGLKLTPTEAFQLFPLGTPVMKRFQSETTGALEFFEGRIVGYKWPWYRIRYLDGDAEEYSKSEVETGVRLHAQQRKALEA